MNLVLYSVITNDYDSPKPVTFKNLPHYLFTDNPEIHAPGWNIIQIEKTNDQRLQRKLKILGHHTLEKYDATIYIDASITLKKNLFSILKSYKGGFIIGSHPNRNCVYAEGLAVKSLKKAPSDLVNIQISEYYRNNFPYGFGMWQAGFMIRDKSKEINEMCKIWHDKLNEHSHRDQLSLPWALWKTGIVPKKINMRQYMIIAKHKKKEPVKVFYSTPWSSDKNIGGANNDFISILPGDPWVCITDGDAAFMLPNWGEIVEKVIYDNGDRFALIGCVTNRLGGLHQCYDGIFDVSCDAYDNYEKALISWETNGTLVEETTGVAGLCMIFKKSTWEKAGGFIENNKSADTLFNKAVRKSGGKIGIARGLYMMHNYRIWERDHKKAKSNYKHLVK